MKDYIEISMYKVVDVPDPDTAVYLFNQLSIEDVSIRIAISIVFAVLTKFVNAVRTIIVQDGHENQDTVVTYTIINHYTVS